MKTEKIYCEFAQCPRCQNEAKYVLRLIDIQEQTLPCYGKFILTAKLLACKEHAEYLCSTAKFRWENEPHNSPETEVNKRISVGMPRQIKLTLVGVRELKPDEGWKSRIEDRRTLKDGDVRGERNE